MIAFLIKEIRVLWKWAIIAGVLMAIGLANLLYAGRQNGQSMVGATFLSVELVAFGLCAAGLGLLLVLDDSRRGRWGFVVTRPVPRWHIFVGKYLAGALVYLLITSMAIAVATVVARDPRMVFAPFAWNFLTPTLFAQASGLLWLAMGMYIASRQAAWFGSRLFPVVVGIGCLAAVITSIHSAVLASLIVAVVTALFAVVGAMLFQKNGDYESQPLWTKPVHFVAVGAGAVAVVAIALSLVGGLLQLFVPRQRGLAPEYRTYALARDGTPLITTHDYLHGVAEYKTLDGIKLANEKDNRADVMSIGTIVQYDWSSRPESLKQWRPRFAESFFQEQRYFSSVWQGQSGNRWSFVSEHGYVTGLDGAGDPIGFIGLNGYSNTASAVVPFKGRRIQHETWMVFSTDEMAVIMDAESRQTNLLYEAKPGEQIVGVSVFRSSEQKADADRQPGENVFVPRLGVLNRACVLTTERIYVLSPTREVVLSMPLPDSPPGADIRSVGIGGGAGGVFYILLQWNNADDQLAQLLKVDAAGQPLASITLPALKQWDRSQYRPGLDQYVEMIAMPPAMAAYGLTRQEINLQRDMPVLATMSVVFVAGLLIMVWRTRVHRLTRGQAALWIVLLFFVGMTAVLILACLRKKPVLVQCRCGKRARTDRATCARCDQSLAPARDPAIEIFEPQHA
jgi:hypothetical protein